MQIFIIVMLCLSWLAPLQAEQEMVLSKVEWTIPKTAEAVLAMPVLQEAMGKLQGSERSRLKIFYPGGDEGSLWAIELRGWLVSLGLESDRIKLISGSQYPDRLQLQIEE